MGVTSPTKSGAGVNVMLPSLSTVKVPCSGCVKVVCLPGVLGSMSTVVRSNVPSVSVSLLMRLKVTGTFSSVLALSLVAMGGVLMTVMVMLALFEVWLLLSLTV